VSLLLNSLRVSIKYNHKTISEKTLDAIRLDIEKAGESATMRKNLFGEILFPTLPDS